MAILTIRNLDDTLKSRLRIQAAYHGRSMEDEARDIIRSALNREPARKGDLGASPGRLDPRQVRTAGWRRVAGCCSGADAWGPFLDE